VKTVRGPGNIVRQVGARNGLQGARIHEEQVALLTLTIKDDRHEHTIVFLLTTCGQFDKKTKNIAEEQLRF
jgi:hypothetical protein